jgi:uncharacterized membrane protein
MPPAACWVNKRGNLVAFGVIMLAASISSPLMEGKHQMQQPPPAQPVQAGIDKKTGATLSYLLWWVTGIVMLFVGKNDPDVKYHAAQSIVFFGAITVLQILVSIITSFVHFLWFVGTIISIYSFFMWLYCLYKAWTGNGARFQIPLVGSTVTPYAEQLANSV